MAGRHGTPSPSWSCMFWYLIMTISPVPSLHNFSTGRFLFILFTNLLLFVLCTFIIQRSCHLNLLKAIYLLTYFEMSVSVSIAGIQCELRASSYIKFIRNLVTIFKLPRRLCNAVYTTFFNTSPRLVCVAQR